MTGRPIWDQPLVTSSSTRAWVRATRIDASAPSERFASTFGRRKDVEHDPGTAVPELTEEERDDPLLRAERELVSAALLAEVASTAAGSSTLKQICKHVLQSIRDDLGSLCAGAVYMLDNDGRSLRFLALFGYPREIASTVRVLPVSESSSAGLVALHHLDLLTDEAHEQAPDSRERCGLMGVDTRWLGLPIERQGKLVGVLSLFIKGKRPFESDEIRLYRGVAAILGNAITNSRLLEAEKDARRRANRELKTTTLLLRAAEAIANWTDLSDVARELAELLEKATSHSRAMVQTWDEARQEIEVVACVGKLPIPVQTRWPLDAVSAGARSALRDGRPRVTDLDRLSQAERGTAAPPFDSHNVFHVPFVLHDRVIGLIVVDDPGESRPFSKREMQVVEGMASHATVAFDKAELLKRERGFSEASRVLAEISALLAASRDLAVTLPLVLERACRLLDSTGAVLAERVAGGWSNKYFYGVTQESMGESHSDEQSPARCAAGRTRQPSLVVDVVSHRGADAGLGERQGYRSYVAYPVVLRDEVLAALSFMFAAPKPSFSESESNFMRRLAYLISVSMESARLFDAEHRIAETLQEALLAMPDALPGLQFAHGYHSATEATRVGGDFYDLFEIEHGVFGVLIGDVAGKGLKAAALTSLVKNTIRAHAMERGKSPSQILALTNEVVYKATPPESFVTVFFGILDRGDGRLIYSNAGHTTGVLIKQGGTTVRLVGTGPIVGAFSGATFDDAETYLDFDELLFLYTDGLTEAQGERDQFGEERVFDLMDELKGEDPAVIVRGVTERVRCYAGGRLTDDLALLAVKRSTGEG
jgi:sigma-B regulation protein RsbU (phosphoserine phosphatase)